MATKVQKGSKINFYKFVPVSETGSSSKLSAANRETISAVNTNTKAVNNLGNTVNGLAKVVTDIKKVQLGRLELAEKNKPKFKPNFTKMIEHFCLSFRGSISKNAIQFIVSF